MIGRMSVANVAMELWEHRMIAAADAGAVAILAGNDTFSEISARLRCSHTTACGYVEAAALLLRIRITAVPFDVIVRLHGSPASVVGAYVAGRRGRTPYASR